MHPQFKDKLYDEFLKLPSKENFRNFMKSSCGEMDEIDFKKSWIEKGHLAKTILSMANSNGGVIIIGVEEADNGIVTPVGISEFKDKAEINNEISKYIPPELDYEIFDYDYDSSEYELMNGKKFQIIVVHETPERLPFISRAEGKNIIKDTIYVRRGTKCEKATAGEIEKILQNKISTLYSNTSTLTLEEHLSQLKILYNELPKKIQVLIKRGNSTLLHSKAFAEALSNLRNYLGEPNEYEEKDNPFYPDESYEEFINRLIKQKKAKIERFLEV